MQAFFPPFLSSLLNPGTAGKATHDKSTSNMFQGKHLPCSHSHLPRAGILGQAPSLPWPRQRLLALRQQRAGSVAGSAGLLCCLPAWRSLLAKFLLWGFSPLPPGVKTGVSLWLGEGPNSAHPHSSGATSSRGRAQTSTLCRHAQSLWLTSCAADGKPADTADGSMHQC